MAHPDYIREKAIELRQRRNLSIDEIAERLALPKTTVYHWVKDIPRGRPRRWNRGQRLGNEAMRRKFAALREAAYDEGVASASSLFADPTFRDFINLYLAEGYKRDRNRVSLGNSDPAIVRLASLWLQTLSHRSATYALQYHADQDLDELRGFWGQALGVDGAAIRLQRKSNSNQLSKRTWRSRYGVLTVTVDDTYLRARLQAWMDHLRGLWDLDSTW